MADRDGPDLPLPVRPDPQESRALRGRRAIVAVPCNRLPRMRRDRAAPCPERGRHRPGYRSRGRRAPPDRVRHRQNMAVGLVTWSRRHKRVREVTRPRTASRFLTHDWSGNGTGPRPRGTPALRGEVERVAAGIVFLVGDEEFIPGLECEGAEDAVDPRRRVGHEDQVVGPGADKARQLGPRFVEHRLQLAHEEAHRLALKPSPQARLVLQHGKGTAAERAVVQEIHASSSIQKGRIARPAAAMDVRALRLLAPRQDRLDLVHDRIHPGRDRAVGRRGVARSTPARLTIS